MELCGSFATALFRPLGEVLLALPKSTQKASPEPRFILRCSQRAGPKQIARGRATARCGLMVLVYDRPLLRSSARGDGALTSNNDRFAIGDGHSDAGTLAARCYLRHH
jgi:hypothetical protein